jgi:hypothetical protein
LQQSIYCTCWKNYICRRINWRSFTLQYLIVSWSSAVKHNLQENAQFLCSPAPKSIKNKFYCCTSLLSQTSFYYVILNHTYSSLILKTCFCRQETIKSPHSLTLYKSCGTYFLPCLGLFCKQRCTVSLSRLVDSSQIASKEIF